MRRILCASGLALALLASSGTAQQWLQLYEHANYLGASLVIYLPANPRQVLNFPSTWHDRASSIRWNLAPNSVLRLYEQSNAGGREYMIPHSSARVGGIANLGSYYDEKFSSLAWNVVDPSAGWVRLFTDTYSGGYQLSRYLSEIPLGPFPISRFGYNDQVDSVSWSLPVNRTILLHDEDPVGGRALPLLDSGYIYDLTQQFSGIHHDKFSTFLTLEGRFTACLADRTAPVDRICQLSSHNAHVSTASGWIWHMQNMGLLEQLDYGARLLQLDVSDNNGVLYLTHGSWSATLAARAGRTPDRLDSALAAIHSWLRSNPREVLFLEFENYTGSTLSTALANSPLGPMLYRPEGLQWPSIEKLADWGKRVVVFDDSSSTTQLYRSDWQVQNGYSSFGSTTPRSESDPIDRLHRSMFLMNHISGSSTPLTWLGNSPNDVGTLYNLATSFGQTPNFINIDGIEMADHGGLEACRAINMNLWNNIPARATAFNYHDGCVDTIQPTAPPRLGSFLTIDATAGSIMILGLTDDRYAGLSLPLSLSPLSTCPLRVSLDVMWTVPSRGNVLVSIANDARYVGVPLYFQTARIASSTRVYLSNGVQATIGY